MEWQYAVSLFVANAANLMKAIKDTLRASKLAITLPNNYSSVTLFPQPLITLKSVQDLRLGDVAVLSQQPHIPKHALYPHSQPPITQNTTFQPPLRNTDMVCPPSPFAGSFRGHWCRTPCYWRSNHCSRLHSHSVTLSHPYQELNLQYLLLIKVLRLWTTTHHYLMHLYHLFLPPQPAPLQALQLKTIIKLYSACLPIPPQPVPL